MNQMISVCKRYQIPQISMQKHTLEQFPFSDYDLENLKLLGQGSYGRVFKSKNKKTGQEVAIKQIDMKKINEQYLQPALEREMTLMKQIKSPNIVELIDSHLGKKYSYMVLELCDTDLRKKMNGSQTRMKEEECVKIFGGIMSGFKALVESSCIHRDVKPENVLIKDNQIKLADFGFARKADLLFGDKYDEMCGTPIYMAPQILSGEPYTSKSDIWSLGLLLYEMIYGSAPWPIKNIDSYSEAIRKRPLGFPYDVKIGKETKDFIKKALVVQQDKRISWQDIFKHPLIKDQIGGQACLTKPVEPKIRLILSKMQSDISKKDIDQNQIFKKYSVHKNLNFQQFSSLLQELNPAITTYETNAIFEACDKNNNNLIDHNEFQEMFCTINYKTDPQIQAQIDEIVGIIKTKKIQVKQLFDKFDKNHTGALDTNQFREMILSIAPRYNWQQLKRLYTKFDGNHSGLVDKKELLEVIGGGLATQHNYVGIWMEKAKRNLDMLKIHLNSKKLQVNDVMKMADFNSDKQIDEQEFLNLLQKVGFLISKEEVKDIFKMLDKDGSSKISFAQLNNYIK